MTTLKPVTEMRHNMDTPNTVRAFLQALDPSHDANFAIETYSDLPKTKKVDPDPLKRRWKDLALDDVMELIPRLELLNQNGAAIYVAVNEFVGHRCKKNLSHIRCAHADMDYATSEQLEELKAICPPSLIVESSPGRYHFYWLIENRLSPDSMTEIENINKGIVSYGADKAATDCSRLLRLPGFRNQKHKDQQ